MTALDLGTLAGLLRLATGMAPYDRDLAVDLCVDVISMAEDLPGDQLGRAARCGAQLLLDLELPDLDPQLRDTLARACESAVLHAV